jgi:cytochrome c nitrite reductase small subunit
MSWLRILKKPMLWLCVLLGVLAGLGAHTFQYAEGFSYAGEDPKACVNCHIMRDQYNGWLVSSHHNHATCNDCHVPAKGLAKWICKADNGYRHSKAFTLQDFHEPIQITETNAAILQQNCLRCHGEFVSTTCGSPDLTRVSVETMNCVRCHADVGHGPTR